jgi:hypothetical protein
MRRAANVGAINTRFSPFYQTKKPIAPIGLLMLPGINSSVPFFRVPFFRSDSIGFRSISGAGFWRVKPLFLVAIKFQLLQRLEQ